MEEFNNKVFNHLKIHTQYSICEGAIKIEDLKNFCKDNKIKSLGLSDTANLCGSLEFSENLSKSGTQPIVGTQIQFNYKDEVGLLPLIAMSETGYKKIQSNLIRPFSKIASKAQLTLNRLGSFFTTLFFGWLTTNTVRAIGALGDGSRDKFNEIISGVGKVLLVLGGAFIASKIGIGKLLSSIITFNFKLKKFSAVGIITAPFRWIGNIIGAIINRIGNLFPWILPGFIYNQQNKKTETDKLDSNNDSTEKIQAKNEGGLIDFKGKLNEIMNSTEELNIPTIKPDESQPLYFDERLKLFDEQTNILRDQNTKLNENNKTFGNNVFKLKENFNEIFFGIEPINKEDTSVGVTTSNTAIPPVEKWEPPENKSYVDFGFNETGSSGAIMPSSTVIEEKKDKIQTYNQEEDTSPIIIPMETAGNDNSQGSIDGSTLPSETNSVPPVGAINYDNLYVFNTYKVFQISPKMI